MLESAADWAQIVLENAAEMPENVLENAVAAGKCVVQKQPLDSASQRHCTRFRCPARATI